MITFFMTKPIMHQKLYNCCVAIIAAIRGTSEEKMYQKLRLESLESIRWFSKLSFFFKILKNKSPDYLFRITPQKNSSYITRNWDKIPLFKTKHNFYKNLFFLSTTIECKNLNQKLRNSESYTLFRSIILKFIRPYPNSFYGLSHLREYKFKHIFQGC